jgi:hypothetical protein
MRTAPMNLNGKLKNNFIFLEKIKEKKYIEW